MKIHYCWFGNNPKSPLILNCIKSWHKYCPSAEIIEWNESNFDINTSIYSKEAYEAKKWPFVSDYCRFYVLYNFGGIYLDTDVELLRPISDLPLNFVGFENKRYVASGLIRGAQKKDWFCKQMLESYNRDKFLLPDGSYNLVTVCERETSLLIEHGLKLDNKTQTVKDITVYASEYFCPLNSRTRELAITKNTYSIHHYAASWCKEESNFYYTTYKKLSQFFPNNLSLALTTVITNIKFHGIRTTFAKIKKRLRGFAKH